MMARETQTQVTTIQANFLCQRCKQTTPSIPRRGNLNQMGGQAAQRKGSDS